MPFDLADIEVENLIDCAYARLRGPAEFLDIETEGLLLLADRIELNRILNIVRQKALLPSVEIEGIKP